MTRCSTCSHNAAETTVPIPLCRRCATAFYSGLLEAAARRRLMCAGPSRQAQEHVEHERARAIVHLAAAVRTAPAGRHRGPRVYFNIDRYALAGLAEAS